MVSLICERDTSKIYEIASIFCKDNSGGVTSTLTLGSIPKSVDKQIALVKSRLSSSWLAQPDQDGDFPTNGDRFAAQELTKRGDSQGFTRKGFICQAMAAGYHKKSPEQVKEIADKVGRERILVIHGTVDNLITVPHGEVLAKELGGEEMGVTKRIFEGRGHYVPIEERAEFRKLIEGIVEKTEAMRRGT